MISLQDFYSMSMKGQTLLIERSFPTNSMSSSKRGLLFGVGVNDADYRVKPKIDGKLVCCPAYHSWKLMLLRAYCAKYHERQPTYSNSHPHISQMLFMIVMLNNPLDYI